MSGPRIGRTTIFVTGGRARNTPRGERVATLNRSHARSSRNPRRARTFRRFRSGKIVVVRSTLLVAKGVGKHDDTRRAPPDRRSRRRGGILGGRLRAAPR